MMLSFWGRDCLDSDGGPGRLSRDRHALAGKRGELLVVASKAIQAISHHQSVGPVPFKFHAIAGALPITLAWAHVFLATHRVGDGSSERLRRCKGAHGQKREDDQDQNCGSSM